MCSIVQPGSDDPDHTCYTLLHGRSWYTLCHLGTMHHSPSCFCTHCAWMDCINPSNIVKENSGNHEYSRHPCCNRALLDTFHQTSLAHTSCHHIDQHDCIWVFPPVPRHLREKTSLSFNTDLVTSRLSRKVIVVVHQNLILMKFLIYWYNLVQEYNLHL